MRNSVAALVFTNDRSQTLAIKRQDAGIWVIPGGAIDPGESEEQACAREVLEETGIEVEVIRKVGIYTPIAVINTITHLFECKPVGGTLKKSAETADLGFFENNAMPRGFFELHQTWIEEALEDKPLIEREIHELTWFSVMRFALMHPFIFFRFAIAKRGVRM